MVTWRCECPLIPACEILFWYSFQEEFWEVVFTVGEKAMAVFPSERDGGLGPVVTGLLTHVNRPRGPWLSSIFCPCSHGTPPVWKQSGQQPDLSFREGGKVRLGVTGPLTRCRLQMSISTELDIHMWLPWGEFWRKLFFFSKVRHTHTHTHYVACNFRELVNFLRLSTSPTFLPRPYGERPCFIKKPVPIQWHTNAVIWSINIKCVRLWAMASTQNQRQLRYDFFTKLLIKQFDHHLLCNCLCTLPACPQRCLD